MNYIFWPKYLSYFGAKGLYFKLFFLGFLSFRGETSREKSYGASEFLNFEEIPGFTKISSRHGLEMMLFCSTGALFNCCCVFFGGFNGVKTGSLNRWDR